MTNKYHIMQNNVAKNGIARDFEINNVAIDGSGIHLTVHPISADGTRVPSGGIYTKKSVVSQACGFSKFIVFSSTDFGFGSYHWSAQTSGIPGSVQAFYVYKTDSNEVCSFGPHLARSCSELIQVDMEYISKPADQKQTIKYTVKPQQYNDDGQPLDTTLQAYTPSFNTSEVRDIRGSLLFLF